MVKLPPSREDVSGIVEISRRLLNSPKRDKIIRNYAKRVLHLAEQVDAYVESVYPCFNLVEERMREDSYALLLESDGVFRLVCPKGRVILSGPTLKELFINAVLVWGDWAEEEEMQEWADEEDLKAGLRLPDPESVESDDI